MTQTAQPFDLIHSSLQGRVLLEASAGTGKTFSVTKMALRYLLQEGRQLEQILLVTFTNLATAELKSALTADCHQMAELLTSITDYTPAGVLTADVLAQFVGDRAESLPTEQQLLLALLQTLDAEQLAAANDRIQLAVKTIDLAAVMTLHELAGRLVNRFGFQVSAPFGKVSSLDTASYKQQATADFYRQHYQQAPPDQQAQDTEDFQSSQGSQASHDRARALPSLPVVIPLLNQQQLADLLALSLNKPSVSIPLSPCHALRRAGNGDARSVIALAAQGELSWSAALRELRQPLDSAIDKVMVGFARLWPRLVAELPALLAQITTLRVDEPDWFQKSKYLQDWLTDHLRQADRWLQCADAITAFAQLPGYRSDVKNPQGAHLLMAFSAAVFPETFLKKANVEKGRSLLPDIALAIEQFAPDFADYTMARSAFEQDFFAYAKAWLTAHYHALLARDYRSDISAAFTQLDTVLSSPQAAQIATAVRQAFPVVIVDEFQDTDPEQFRILSRLYPDTQQHNLIMVGDPKQSIYRFRGADIYAYLSVIQQVNHYYYLTTNYRSDPGIVAGVNALFREDTAAAEQSFRIPDLSFIPVEAHHQQSRLHLGAGLSSAPIQLLTAGVDQPTEDQWIDLLLNDIQRLLANSQLSQLQRGDEQRALSLSDVAILVRGNDLGKAIYAAAKRFGYNAVLHADDNVLQTAAARSLALVLRVLLAPRSDQISFTLLSPLLGWSAQQIRTHKDAGEWTTVLATWHQAQLDWSKHGISSALRLIFQDFAVAEQLLQRGDVRLLADVEQLIELLHSQEQRLSLSPEALCQWFERCVAEPEQWSGDDREVYQRRLDTDQPAITIMTIHKSKGLEFPVVYLPCLYKFATGKGDALKVAHFPAAAPADVQDGDTSLDNLSPSGAQTIAIPKPDAPHLSSSWSSAFLAQVEREQVAENLRLLYVALTRASSRLVLMDNWQQKAYQKPKHPLFALLHREAKSAVDSADIYAKIDVLSREHPECFSRQTVQAAEIALPQFWQPSATELPTLTLQTFPGDLQPSWVMTSFSALKSAASADKVPAEVVPAIEPLDERLSEPTLAQSVSPSASSSLSSRSGSSLSGNIEPNQLPDLGVLAGLPTSPDSSESSDSSGMPNTGVPDALPYRFDFPAGAVYGTLLHDVFETIGFDDLAAKNDTAKSQLLSLLKHHAAPKPILPWPLLEWLSALVRQPIMPMVAGEALIDWRDTSIAEIEFSFPITAPGMQAFIAEARQLEPLFPGVGAWLDAHPLTLVQMAHKGYLKGFIDLTFRNGQQQYGILDYKSNHLGTTEADYAEPSMTAMMVESGYWLQLVIYSIALHRWLQQRLPDYRYARDCCGGVFLFLRGMDADTPSGNGVFHRMIPEAQLLALSDCLGASTA